MAGKEGFGKGMSPQNRERVARAGGLAISRDREHMRALGRKGGAVTGARLEHMREIGRKGSIAALEAKRLKKAEAAQRLLDLPVSVL